MDGRLINIKTKISDMETLMIMALEGDFQFRNEVQEVSKIGGMERGLRDQGALLNMGEMLPSSMYTFDMCDIDRLFTTDISLLLEHPSDILGSEKEIIMNNHGEYKWTGYRRVKRPKRVSILGKADMYYEAHYRKIYSNGRKTYKKRIIPLDKKGTPLLCRIQGHDVCSPAVEGQYLVIACSMIEDVHRTGVMLASFKEGVEIKLSVPLDDYKEIFFDREAPLVKGKKKAIIHWVSQHIRESKKGKLHSVCKHVRGIKDILIDGMLVNIQPT